VAVGGQSAEENICRQPEAGENYIIRNFIICNPNGIYWDDQIMEYAIGGECSRRGDVGYWTQNFCRKS
jgi:hypothetical protein